MYETVAFAVQTTTSPSLLGDTTAVREVPIYTIQVAHQQPLGKQLPPHLSGCRDPCGLMFDTTMWGPRTIAKLANTTSITMVYDTYNL